MSHPLLRPLFIFMATLSLALSLSACGSSKVMTVKGGQFYGIDVAQDERVIFVLDISGSMDESDVSSTGGVVRDTATSAVGSLLGNTAKSLVMSAREMFEKRIEVAKTQLIAAVMGLSDQSTFNVVLFRQSAERLSPIPMPSNIGTKAAISHFVSKLEAGGGTDMKGGILDALKMEPTHMIILGDGMPTSSSPQAIRDLLMARNQGKFKVSTVGIGSGQATAFMRAIAEENGGFFIQVD